MATYRRMLKDKDNNNIIPALPNASIKSNDIDWSELTGSSVTAISGPGGIVNLRKLFPHIYMVTGNITTGATRTWTLPSINPLDTPQVFFVYGSGTTVCKGYVDPGASTLTVQSNTSGTFSLAQILYLAD